LTPILILEFPCAFKVDYQSQVYYAIAIEAWIPEDHPLRPAAKCRADGILMSMRRDSDRAYSRIGRRSIPSEMLLKALLLKRWTLTRGMRRGPSFTNLGQVPEMCKKA